MDSISRRGFAALAAAWPALALAPAPARAQERALRVAAPWEITGLDPARSGYIFGRLQIAENLTANDDGGLPQPALAASWELAEDRLAWRFLLRPGATFHDGTRVTAVAVARALERARTPPGLLATAPIAAITADGEAVVIRTTRPFLSLPSFLSHYSAIVLAPSSFDDNGAVRRIVGSGPYRAVEVSPPLRVEVARFEGWDGPRPAIERVSYLAVPRGETRAVMAEGGQAELVYTLDPASIERLRRSRRIDVRVLTIPRVVTIKLNAGSPFFAAVEARRAISLALDRTAMARTILRSPQAAATQLLPPTLAEWHVGDLPPLRHDPAEARRLLAQAGWTPGPDGILARDGRRFSVTMRTFSTRPELPVLAAAIQHQLRIVGIAVEVAVGNSSEIPSGHRDGTLEMGLMARSFALVPDPIATLLEDFGPEGGDWGAMSWSSAALIEALAALGATADVAERRRLRARVAAILHEELPVLPLAWYDHTVAVSRRLAGVTVDPFEISYRVAAMRWAD